MTNVFQHELDLLKGHILELCALVEERLQLTIRALVEANREHAIFVIDNDGEVDEKEVLLEEECLKVLALHQPVAIDLRFVVAVLKINSDLERIGDLAVNIASHVIELNSHTQRSPIYDFIPMSECVKQMVSQSIDSLVNLDVNTARQVTQADDEVDNHNDACQRIVEEQLKVDPSKADTHTLLHTAALARDLERIADHATNIAEDVLYLIEGNIVRHSPA
jgi:phosphate transport system protein